MTENRCHRNIPTRMVVCGRIDDRSLRIRRKYLKLFRNKMAVELRGNISYASIVRKYKT